MLLVALSHLVNVIIVTIIPWLIYRNAPSMTAVYGPDTPARRILACLYATIALASAVALFCQFGYGLAEVSMQIALVLFPLQIAYKLATAFAVGLGSPVVISNLAIAGLHSASLAAFLWPQAWI
ncbi:MAG TPA: hypothetical protein EYG02_00860 [Henriciella marina]|uniref:hypothetical protein n=1 Tax=Henriciella sp. TaxID=1968823 RepID=UPI00182AFE2B|nr:hypothetical protein [Henriciella sp.]HIG23603.1 hypothetical protein [Henriciella sp.]HIK63562.1 hypothetical protein [Henriciella marina]